MGVRIFSGDAERPVSVGDVDSVPMALKVSVEEMVVDSVHQDTDCAWLMDGVNVGVPGDFVRDGVWVRDGEGDSDSVGERSAERECTLLVSDWLRCCVNDNVPRDADTDEEN